MLRLQCVESALKITHGPCPSYRNASRSAQSGKPEAVRCGIGSNGETLRTPSSIGEDWVEGAVGGSSEAETSLTYAITGNKQVAGKSVSGDPLSC